MADTDPDAWRSRQPLYGGSDDQPSKPARRHYTERQLSRCPHYVGKLTEFTEDEVREFLREVLRYFDLSGPGMPFPPTGLPGALHREFSWDDPEWGLLWAGIDYFRACAEDKPRTMMNTWDRVTKKLERFKNTTPAPVIWEFKPDRSPCRDERPKMVYFIGSESGPIKIGMAVEPPSRLASLQTSHHEKLSILATCKGGHDRERAYHARFAAHRLHGEWFERTPELLAEIERLSTPTLLADEED